jgi:hypothetical protein
MGAGAMFRYLPSTTPFELDFSQLFQPLPPHHETFLHRAVHHLENSVHLLLVAVTLVFVWVLWPFTMRVLGATG